MTSEHTLSNQRSRSINSASNEQVNTNVSFKDQKKTFTKHFDESCPLRLENIDRRAMIKRQDMESCLKRLSARDDVYGVLVATIDGRILYECENLKKWIPTLGILCSFARHLVRNHDPDDIIQALRLRTKNYEIIITIRQEQLLVVMQMISNTCSKNIDIDNSIFEEDWQTFLKRIQQKRIDNE